MRCASLSTRWSLSIGVVGAALGGCSAAAIEGPVDQDGGAMDVAAPDEGVVDSGAFVDVGPPCSADDFCRTSLPIVPPPYLTSIFAASPTRTLATSTDGTVFLWNGATWSIVALGYGELSSVWASDADHFWMVDSGSLMRVTFEGDRVVITHEELPYDRSSCFPFSLSISGTSESDVFVAGYCAGFSFPNGNFESDVTGVLFHRGVAHGDPGDAGPSWSLLSTFGGSGVAKVALGAVVAVSPGGALVAGWKSPNLSDYSSPATLIPPDPNDPFNSGTTTFVLHVQDGVIEEEDLDSSLAMCATSLWTTPSQDNVFVAGVCGSIEGVYDPFGRDTQYTSVAHRAKLEDGGAAWTAVVHGPFVNYLDLPGLVFGFGEAQVYAAGPYAMQWDGSAFGLVHLAINGAPLATRAAAMQGLSEDDFWIVGDQFALHRKR